MFVPPDKRDRTVLPYGPFWLADTIARKLKCSVLTLRGGLTTVITTAPVSGVYTFQALNSSISLSPGQYQITAYGYNETNLNYNASPTTGVTVDASFNDLCGALTRGGAYYNPTAGNVGTTFDVFSIAYGGGNFTASVLAVPLPIAGGGLAGLIFACGGLLAWWRRKRSFTQMHNPSTV